MITGTTSAAVVLHECISGYVDASWSLETRCGEDSHQKFFFASEHCKTCPSPYFKTKHTLPWEEACYTIDDRGASSFFLGFFISRGKDTSFWTHKLTWREKYLLLIPDEIPHGLGTQRESRKKKAYYDINDDFVFRSPVIWKKKQT